MPQAPSVGDSQLSSSNRMSCWRGIDAARLQAVEIDPLHVVGRRLQDDLVLVVLEQAVGVLAEAAVVGTPRRLHVGHAPRLGPEHAEERLGVRGAGADLEVERLLQQAPVRGPERRQLENEVLKGHANNRSRVAAKVAKHAVRFQRLLQVHRDERTVHRLQLLEHPLVGLQAPGVPGTGRPRRRQKPPGALRQRATRPPGRRPAGAAPSTRSSAPAARTGTPAASASSIDAPSRYSRSSASASCAHSFRSSAK